MYKFQLIVPYKNYVLGSDDDLGRELFDICMTWSNDNLSFKHLHTNDRFVVTF